MIKADKNLVMTVDVVDFGCASVRWSAENPGLVRLMLTDEVGGGKQVIFDMDNDEALSLINALSMYVED